MPIRIIILALLLCCTLSPHAHADDTTVVEAERRFDQNALALQSGDTLTLINRDDITHNIQVVGPDGRTVDKGLQKAGQQTKIYFSKSGIYKVRCSIYPQMRITVTVR